MVAEVRFCRWALVRKHIKACVAQFLYAFDQSKRTSEQHKSTIRPNRALFSCVLEKLEYFSVSNCAPSFRARFGISNIILRLLCVYAWRA